jgi:hypothetical protein
MNINTSGKGHAMINLKKDAVSTFPMGDLSPYHSFTCKDAAKIEAAKAAWKKAEAMDFESIAKAAEADRHEFLSVRDGILAVSGPTEDEREAQAAIVVLRTATLAVSEMFFCKCHSDDQENVRNILTTMLKGDSLETWFKNKRP